MSVQHDGERRGDPATAPLRLAIVGSDGQALASAAQAEGRSDLGAVPDLPLHPWPAEKVGGAEPDRCPTCGEPSYRRVLRPDGGWHRPQVEVLTCSRCRSTWTAEPIVEPERGPVDPQWRPVTPRPGSLTRPAQNVATEEAEPDRPQLRPRRCPSCREVAFVATAEDGSPLAPGERRCWGCNQVWTPAEAVIDETATGTGPWRGELAGEATGDVIWRCSHDHGRQSEAMQCAEAELDRRLAATRRPAEERAPEAEASR